jgi:IS5 family transposase
MFKMLFLEFYYNLSDVEAAKQCNYNILYRYFIGIKIDEPAPDDTSLVVFRNRLGEQRFERLFNRIVLQAKEKNLLEGKLKIVDSSKVIADVAIPNAVNLLRQGRRITIRKISKINPHRAEKLIKCYDNKEKLFTKPTEEALIQEIAESKQLIKEVKGKYTPEVDELCEVLDKIISGKSEEKIVSFSDLDARFGKTSRNEKGFAGYKAHIAEDQSEIITSTDTTKGNEDEGSHLKTILEKDQGKGITHKAVVADAKYDSAKNRADIHKKDMAAYIPSGRGSKKYLDNFYYNETQDTLVCQQGHSPISKSCQEEGYLYIFSAKDCRGCPDRTLCPRPNEGRTRLFISDNHKLKLIDNTPQRKEAIILRKMIERKFGEAKKWHGLSRARYRGKWRVAIQVIMTFLVMNVKRIVKLLNEKLKLSTSKRVLAAEFG